MFHYGMESLPHARFQKIFSNSRNSLKPIKFDNNVNLFKKRKRGTDNRLRIARHQFENQIGFNLNGNEKRSYVVHIDDKRPEGVSYFIDILHQIRLNYKYSLNTDENIFYDAKCDYYDYNGFGFMGYNRQKPFKLDIDKILTLRRMRR